MPAKKRLVDDFEQRIKRALITQNTLARALGVSDTVFTRKLKQYNGHSFNIGEARIIEKMLKIKLLEPLNH